MGAKRYKKKNNYSEDSGFSGLEAAIVLIAFIVVGAVFGFSLVGSGFFASAKTQEATGSGVKQSTSNVIVDGYLYGEYSTQLDSLNFLIIVPEGNQPSFLSDIMYVYSYNGGIPHEIPGTYPGGETIVSSDKPVQVVLNSLEGPTEGGKFTLQVMPKFGASCFLSRKLDDGYTGGIILGA